MARTMPPLLKGGAAAAAEGFGPCLIHYFSGFSLFLCYSVSRACFVISSLVFRRNLFEAEGDTAAFFVYGQDQHFQNIAD